jgi:DNA-binding transcriptional LysR family regulator
MDVRLLSSFLTVAELGSMTDAAVSLGLSGPAISQQMARLEADLGVVLFNRSRNGVELTPAGEELRLRSQTVIGAVTDIRSAVQQRSASQQAPIRLEAFPSASVYLLPHVLKELRRLKSGVPISLVSLSDANLFGRVNAGEVDLSIGYDYDFVSIQAPASLVVEELGRDRFDVLLPKSHRLAAKRAISLRDLQDEDWVLFPPATMFTESVLGACAKAGFSPRTMFEVSDYQVVEVLVAAGAGVSLWPRMVTNSLPKKGLAVRPLLRTDFGRNVFVSYRRTFDRSRVVNIIAALHEAFRSSVTKTQIN